MARKLRIIRLVLVTSLLGSILGCAIGPDYKEPAPALPSSFENTPEESESAGVDDQILWWKYLDDPQLDQLLETGVRENHEVRQALSRINQSRALARLAFAELLPGALLNGSYAKGEDTGSRFPEGDSSFRYQVYSASVDALWEIDLSGRLRRELEARNAEYDRDVAELHDVMRMFISEIVLSYVELRAAQSQLAIATNNRRLQADSLKLVQTRLDYGAVNELDLARSQTQLAQTEARISPLDAAVKIQAHRIAVLLGKEPNFYQAHLSEKRKIPEFTGPVAIVSPEQLIRRRPDLRAAERVLAAHTARIGVAVGELFPKITVSGSLGVDAPHFSDLNRNTSFYSFGPNISWAAFDTGRLRARVNLEEQATREALLGYERAVLGALEDVENAFVTYASQKSRQVQLLKAAASSKRAYEIADVQYREGVLDFLSVLDAQRTLLESESELVEGKKQLTLALVGIYKAFGGGWEAWDLVNDPGGQEPEI